MAIETEENTNVNNIEIVHRKTVDTITTVFEDNAFYLGSILHKSIITAMNCHGDGFQGGHRQFMPYNEWISYHAESLHTITEFSEGEALGSDELEKFNEFYNSIYFAFNELQYFEEQVSGESYSAEIDQQIGIAVDTVLFKRFFEYTDLNIEKLANELVHNARARTKRIKQITNTNSLNEDTFGDNNFVIDNIPSRRGLRPTENTVMDIYETKELRARIIVALRQETAESLQDKGISLDDLREFGIDGLLPSENNRTMDIASNQSEIYLNFTDFIGQNGIAQVLSSLKILAKPESKVLLHYLGFLGNTQQEEFCTNNGINKIQYRTLLNSGIYTISNNEAVDEELLRLEKYQVPISLMVKEGRAIEIGSYRYQLSYATELEHAELLKLPKKLQSILALTLQTEGANKGIIVFSNSTHDISDKLGIPEESISSSLKKILEFIEGDILLDSNNRKIPEGTSRYKLIKEYSNLPNDKSSLLTEEQKKLLHTTTTLNENGRYPTMEEITALLNLNATPSSKLRRIITLLDQSEQHDMLDSKGNVPSEGSPRYNIYKLYHQNKIDWKRLAYLTERQQEYLKALLLKDEHGYYPTIEQYKEETGLNGGYQITISQLEADLSKTDEPIHHFIDLIFSTPLEEFLARDISHIKALKVKLQNGMSIRSTGSGVALKNISDSLGLTIGATRGLIKRAQGRATIH